MWSTTVFIVIRCTNGLGDDDAALAVPTDPKTSVNAMTIAKMILNARYKDLRAIMLKGITIAGFNLVDIEKLNQDTGLPVIVVMRRMPDLSSIEKALTNLNHKEERLAIIEKAGKIYEGKVQGDSDIFFQFKGIEEDDAREIIRISSMHSNIPEPLRVSHIIATGVVKGESTKKP